MNLDYDVIICIGVALLCILIAIAPRGKKREFIARQFLTENEMEFLSRLERAAPELRFHAQVSMGAVLEAAIPRQQDVTAHMRARGKFSQKIIDFVAQSKRTGDIVAIIELDDRTHDLEKDRKRDEMLFEAGYNIVRWDSRAKPQTKEIRDTLLSL